MRDRKQKSQGREKKDSTLTTKNKGGERDNRGEDKNKNRREETPISRQEREKSGRGNRKLEREYIKNID